MNYPQPQFPLNFTQKYFSQTYFSVLLLPNISLKRTEKNNYSMQKPLKQGYPFYYQV
jgi:hypothetical protein